MGRVNENRAKARKAGQSMKEFKAARSQSKPRVSGKDASAAVQARRADKRAVAQQSFDSQGSVTSAANFDFAKHSADKVGAREVKHLRKSGMDRQDIQNAAADSGLKIGQNAQKRFDRWDARKAAKERVNGTKGEPTPPLATTQAVGENGGGGTKPPVMTTQAVGENGGGGTKQEIRHEPPVMDRTQAMYENGGGGTKPPVMTTQAVGENGGGGTKPESPGLDRTMATYENGGGGMEYSTQAVGENGGGNIDIEDSYNNENEQNVDYEQELNINQDNDINNTVNGDGNVITNNQDNSIRNYGGDQRVFNYQNTGGGPDSPVSAATMGGYYAPSDGHAANAARLDRQVTQANDYAKDNMNTDWIAQGAIKKAEQNMFIDPAALDQRVNERATASKARAHMMGQSIYGDIFGKMPNWLNMSGSK